MIHTYNLARRNISVDSLHPYVHAYCADYLTDSEPDFFVRITQNDIDFERGKSGGELCTFSDAGLEVSAVFRKIAERMPSFSTILIHGSALSVDGEAYMFTAPSGTGKSTHSRLWREYLPGRVIMINDDKPFVRITDNKVEVFGSPFCGKEGLNTNTSAELRAICILERAEENNIHEITAREAYTDMLRQTYRPQDRAAFVKTLELLDALGRCVKFYRLGCNMNLEAAKLAYRTMKGDCEA